MRGAATQAMRHIVEERQRSSHRLVARNPSGCCRSRAICGVARRQRCYHIASSSLIASRPRAAAAKSYQSTKGGT